jgi:hypothetical protein
MEKLSKTNYAFENMKKYFRKMRHGPEDNTLPWNVRFVKQIQSSKHSCLAGRDKHLPEFKGRKQYFL